MAENLVLAYYMNEHEDELIAANVAKATRTDSYYLAEVTEVQLQLLIEAGIILQMITGNEETGQTNFEAVSASAGFRSAHNPPDEVLAGEERDTGLPAYFLFSIKGPLLEQYTVQLKESQIEIVERYLKDTYLTRILTIPQHEKLLSLPFVFDVRFYNSKDTGVSVIENNFESVPNGVAQTQMVSYDILLHNAKDRNALLKLLKKENFEITGSAGSKIRIVTGNDDILGDLAANVMVHSIEQYIPPKLHNDLARKITNIGVLQQSVKTTDNYTGKGEIIGVADTGIDDKHPDLVKHIAGISAWGRKNDHSDPNGHGTHVAGSIAGDGKSSGGKIKGIAPGAKIFFQSIMNDLEGLNLPLQIAKLFEEAYKNGARIHNNSWGSSTASKYTISSIEVDNFVASHRDMLLVFSAGNDGNGSKPVNVKKGFADFLSIGSPASAKNILTVGASRSSRSDGGYAKQTYGEIWPDAFPFPPLNTEKVSGNIDSLAGFSSRGPCDDNRIKPDIIGPGTDIVSTRSAQAPLSNFWGLYPGDEKYAIMGGTSMAAPIVAGCAAVVREYYKKTLKHPPSAALLKATLINGAKKMNGADCITGFPELPNYNQGFGLVNMETTIPGRSKNMSLYFFDNYKDTFTQFKITGQRKRFGINIKQGTWLRICMAYTDIAGRSLQNNLNLMVDYEGKKWIGNEKVASLLKMPDGTNNVETIVIENAKPGLYTVQVSVTNLIKGPQDFAMVVTTGHNATTSSELK